MEKNNKMENGKNKEVAKMEMVEFVTKTIEGTDITLQLPVVNMYLGVQYDVNTIYDNFTFNGNPQQPNRVPMERSIDFTKVLQNEIIAVSQMELTDKWTVTLLFVENERNGKVGRMAKCGYIHNKEFTEFVLTNGTPATVIDVIGKVTKVTNWKNAHKLYLKVSGRTSQKTTTEKVIAQTSAIEL